MLTMDLRQFALHLLMLLLNVIKISTAELHQLNDKNWAKLADNFEVNWKHSNGISITFELNVKTESGDRSLESLEHYVGLGISNSGGMRGADIVTIAYNESGLIKIQDMHGIGNQAPIMDKKQNWILEYFSKSESNLKIRISRKVTSCDDEDLSITDNTQYLIWSYGNYSNTKIKYHSVNRGSKAVNLLDPVYSPGNYDSYQVFPMHQDIILTKERTLYWCKFHLVPDFGTKHHIIGFAINQEDKTSVNHAHHGSILSCSPPLGEDPDVFFSPFVRNEGYDCYFSQEKIPVDYCKRFDFQWTLGGTKTMLPPNVGVPFGEERKYYMTMMHLDNPSLTPGIKFTTGLDLFYTNATRKFDAGFFQIGINSTKTFSLTIPPNSTDYTLSSHCPPVCTGGIRSEGVFVFSYLLHFHLAGRKMKIRHFRNNVELPWIANDENYDTNYQNTRMLRKEVQVLPMDHLTVECQYDTTDRNGKVVIGGRGIFDEMCQAFLMYYPKVNSLNRCGSGFPQNKMLEFMNIPNIFLPKGDNDPYVLSSESRPGQRYTNIVEHYINWTVSKRKEYQLLTQYGEQEAECSRLGRGDRIMSKYPKIPQSYSPINYCGSATALSISIYIPISMIFYVLIFISI